MVQLVRDGLAYGEPVTVAVQGRGLALLRSELGGDAENVDLIDMTSAGRNPGWILPVLVAFADAHPRGPVRIIVEPVWPGRSGLEYPACLQHEALVNLAFAKRPVTVICPYDAGRLGPAELDDAHRTHPRLGSPEHGWYDSPGYAPAQVIAECNRPLAPPQGPVTTFEFDRGNLARARRLAAEQAGAGQVPADRLQDIVQVVGELTANSIVHGGGSGVLRIWSESGHVVCEVSDRGHISDPLAGREPAGSKQLHGRGLLMVNLLSDLVRMHTAPAGTTVRTYFAAPTAHPPRPGPTTSDNAAAPLAS
jgi:anti-sigma regulatory factor (Ser/Thr protein kinase)